MGVCAGILMSAGVIDMIKKLLGIGISSLAVVHLLGFGVTVLAQSYGEGSYGGGVYSESSNPGTNPNPPTRPSDPAPPATNQPQPPSPSPGVSGSSPGSVQTQPQGGSAGGTSPGVPGSRPGVNSQSESDSSTSSDTTRVDDSPGRQVERSQSQSQSSSGRGNSSRDSRTSSGSEQEAVTAEMQDDSTASNPGAIWLSVGFILLAILLVAVGLIIRKRKNNSQSTPH